MKKEVKQYRYTIFCPHCGKEETIDKSNHLQQFKAITLLCHSCNKVYDITYIGTN